MMYEFTWKVFKETGNVNTYLLLKELEKDDHLDILTQIDEREEEGKPIS